MLPGEQADIPQETLLHLRDLIEDAADKVLDERERFVFEAVVIGRWSLRSFGLPKTTVARIRDKAIKKLRLELESRPEILKHLEQ